MDGIYRDRRDGGRQLAERVEAREYPDPVVLGLVRGGVVVAEEVARTLHAPLDVFVVRKIGAPENPELAIGAIAENGARFLEYERIALLRVTSEELNAIVEREQRELERRVRAYRGNRSLVPIAGRTAIVVDDGIATGATVRVAGEALRAEHPARLVLATPVAPPESIAQLHRIYDEVICPLQPEPFYAVGLWYDEFAPVEDDEVKAILAGQWPPLPEAGEYRAPFTR